MNLSHIFTDLFGDQQWLGLPAGFWAGLGICIAVVVMMNLIFWGMKPKKR